MASGRTRAGPHPQQREDRRQSPTEQDDEAQHLHRLRPGADEDEAQLTLQALREADGTVPPDG